MFAVVDSSTRSCFAGAAAGFTELVRQVRFDGWDRPALGAWTVRDLVGHTSRALSTIEAYLGGPPTGHVIAGPVEYFVAALHGADHDAMRIVAVKPALR